MSRAYVASALLAAFLAAVAFVAAGGTELGRSTVAEILLVAVGAALVIAALCQPPARAGLRADCR